MTLETLYWLLGTAILWGLIVFSIMLLALIGLAVTLLRPSVACPDELVGVLAEPQSAGMTAGQQLQAVRCLLVWVLASKTSLDILHRRLRRVLRILWILVPASVLLGGAGWAVHQAGTEAGNPARYDWLEPALGLVLGLEAATLALIMSILGRRSLDRIREAVDFLVTVRTRQLEPGAGPPPAAGPSAGVTLKGWIGFLVLFGLSFAPPASGQTATSQPATASAPVEIVLRIDPYGAYYAENDRTPLAAFQLAQWLSEERRTTPGRPVRICCARKLLDRERQQVQRALLRCKVTPEEITWIEPENGGTTAPVTQPGITEEEYDRWLELLARRPAPASQPLAGSADPTPPIIVLLQACQSWMERVHQPMNPTTTQTKGPATKPAQHPASSPASWPYAE